MKGVICVDQWQQYETLSMCTGDLSALWDTTKHVKNQERARGSPGFHAIKAITSSSKNPSGCEVKAYSTKEGTC